MNILYFICNYHLRVTTAVNQGAFCARLKLAKSYGENVCSVRWTEWSSMVTTLQTEKHCNKVTLSLKTSYIWNLTKKATSCL